MFLNKCLRPDCVRALVSGTNVVTASVDRTNITRAILLEYNNFRKMFLDIMILS
jgi:hypothetical protein